jgi:hypothetical protein
MRKTGILRIDVNAGISTLDSGPNDQNRLAKQGAGDQFGNATNFLVGERGLGDGDFIFVDGNPPSGGVIVITDAGQVGEAVGSNNLVTSAKSGKKKPASKKAGAKRKPK